MGDHSARRILGCAGLLASVAMSAGCSDGGDADSSTVPTLAPAETTTTLVVITNPPEPTVATTAPPSAPPVTSAPEEGAAAPDAGATLQQALTAAEPGYHFTTTITAGGGEALTAEGDRVADRTRMAVTSNGATVSYIVTPDATWVAESGTWQELDQASPVTDPLASLGTPQQITVTEFGDGRVVLTAVYAASTLGLPGTGTVDVTIEVVDGALAALGYSDPASSPPASVRTVISPLTDTSPVTVPTV